MTMSSMPSPVVTLAQPFDVDRSTRNHPWQIHALSSTAAHTHQKLSILHRTDKILDALQMRREHPDLVKNSPAEGDVSRQQPAWARARNDQLVWSIVQEG